MKINLEFETKNEEILKSDMDKIETNFKLPMQCEFNYKPIKKVEIQGLAFARQIPSANIHMKEFGLIIFSNCNFKNNEDERQLTILHEIIHIFFLKNNLHRWKTTKENYEEKINRYIKNSSDANFSKINEEFSHKKSIINLTLGNLDEMWAEKYMKDKYPRLFIKRIKFLYKMLKKNIKEKTEDKPFFKKYPSLQKFIWFWQLIRISFLLNLIGKDDKQSSRLFKELHKYVMEKLCSLIDNEEIKFFENYEVRLCGFSEYPYPKKIVKSYLEIGNFIFKFKV